MKRRPLGRGLPYVATGIWIVLTVSLATWWLVLGLKQADQLDALGRPQSMELEHVRGMLAWEGGTFIGLLLVGGTGLWLSVRREHLRRREIEAFFMAFTHDLKTSLASLQLQAESLREDLPEVRDNANLDRLMKDALRLQLQLENSLYFAEPDGGLYLEPVDLAAFIRRVSADWPELTVEVRGDAHALVDSRALESVVRNLLQNAVTHGHASTMTITVDTRAGRVIITATDDGRGAPAEVIETLGRPFSRPTPMSGTGVGLFVSRRLVRRMRGDLAFAASPGSGFTAVLDLPRAD